MTAFSNLRQLSWTALALIAWVLFGGVALADGPEATRIELLPPTGAAVGQETSLSARVTAKATGAPVPGVEVVFTRTAQFMNTESEVVLGKALSDKQGLATFSFVPRSEGEIALSAAFAGSTQYQRSTASAQAAIATGPAQYVETAGVQVKGVNVMWLVAVLAIVWSVYFAVMGLLALIAREGEREPQAGRGLTRT